MNSKQRSHITINKVNTKTRTESIHRIRTLSKNRRLVRKQRGLIIDTAFQVFAQIGYEKTTVRTIAAKAGMTPGNIYRYIGSKDDILHLLCQQAYNNTQRLTNAFNENISKDTSVTEALRRAIINYLKMSDGFSNAFLFYDRNVQSLSEQDRTIVRDTWVDLVSFFEKLIQKGVSQGEFEVKYPALLAHNIASLGHDWALRKWFLSEHYSLSEFADKQIEILMNTPLVVQGKREQKQTNKL